MRRWYGWLIGSACVVALIVIVALLSSPARLYRLTRSQYQFNRAVSGSVPKGASLTQLEAVVGPGTRTSGPSWLRRQTSSDPARFPDGWREGDDYAMYRFPDNSTWYFQVREGRLVNYDPAVLADQPQEKFAAVR